MGNFGELGTFTFMAELALPKGLTRLIASGVWPSARGPSMAAQQLHPLVAPKNVTRFADDELTGFTFLCQSMS